MTTPRALPGADLAEVVADLYSAVTSESPETSLTRTVERITARAADVAVPYSQAAEHLGVSVPTVDTWVTRGVLARVADAPVRSVTAASLGRVLSVLRRIDDLKPTQRQLIRVVEELRNRDLLDAARRAHATGQVQGPAASVVTHEELANL